MRIATASYDIGFFSESSFSNYEEKILRWVTSAEDAGLLVFPEYFSMELASLFRADIYRSLSRTLTAMQDLLPDFLRLFQKLADDRGAVIVAGSFPVAVASAEYRNRSFVFRPGCKPDFQDKLMMTRFEKERWMISPGSDIRIFQTDFGKIAINLCYDSEFPIFARKQAEAGAGLIVVPSCTDTEAGYHRVRIACQARALENQCFVVQSCTAGTASWSPAVDENKGAAAVFTPVDYGFPADGVLAMGMRDQPGWTLADIDLDQLNRVRKEGQVLNYQDWPDQFRAAGPL
jgi:predicted amidohydrolase